MLRLNPEQQKALEALALKRDLHRVGAALGLAFPEVDARLGERKAALLQLGWEKAQALDLRHGLAFARYLAAWIVFGAEFETKPGFEWAKALLSQPERKEGLRIFQLGRRAREELQRRNARPGSGLPSVADFDAALALLDGKLAKQGRMGSLLKRERLKLGSACDIDAVDLTLVNQAWRQHYALAQGQWRRLPTALDPDKMRVLSMQGQSQLPAQLNLLSQAQGGMARLRLRCRAAHVCDPATHPLVNFNGSHGQYDRRGPLTQDLQLVLPCEVVPPPEPAMAAETGATISRLAMGGCGLRDSGAPMGEQSVLLAVYSAEQLMLAWRREKVQPFTLPADPMPVAAEPRARMERDGQVLDARRWQTGLAELDAQLAQNLARLLTTWEREAGVVDGQLHAEPAVLAGATGLCWGWAEGPEGMSAPPYMRVQALVDLLAWQLNLTLSGRLELEGSQTRLTLQCLGQEKLKLEWLRSAEQADIAAALKPLQLEFQHPFQLSLQTLASPELATLHLLKPVAGALVGRIGLRPSNLGSGLQWFVEIKTEPVKAVYRLHDPVLGQQDIEKTLLPPQTLLDWSLA